jgi:non-specific serine/threonine protein kinase
MASVDHNLPAEHIPPIGRNDEAAAMRVFLLDPATPLVTLIGPGGIGKTTLALHLAHDILDSFPDGVHFIDLTPLSQPDLIPGQIARAVGVEETAGRTTEDTLIAHYHDRRALLLLDNFEHLLPGARMVGTLLRACPTVHVLATSREALRLKEEQVFPLPPLALPDATRLPDVGQLLQVPAIELFVRRAQAVRPGFVLTVENAASVAAIVARLDGLPLGIELAAARVRLFPPKVLLERLEASPLGLLVSGARDAPERQQTVRATIAWSYGLLEPADQRLFRRLGVFADGFTLEAAEAVAAAAFAEDEIDVLTGLESLLDKSLIVRLPVEDELRFGLLETLRAFALEQLAATHELAATRRAHLNHYLALAEEANSHYRGADQEIWLTRIDTAEDNLRLALGRVLDEATAAPAWAAQAVQLAGALGGFWHLRARPIEGRRWLERAQALTASPPAVVLPADRPRVEHEARVHSAAGTMAWMNGDFAAAIPHHRNALACYRALDDQPHVAETLTDLAVQYGRMNDTEQAIELLSESLAIARRLEAWWEVGRTLNNLGVMEEDRGDDAAAEAYHREGLAYAQRAGDPLLTAISMANIGLIAMRGERLDEAEQFIIGALTLSHEAGNNLQLVSCLLIRGEVARRRGDYETARQIYRQGLGLAREHEYRYYFVIGLHALAVLELDSGQARKAARLAGAVAALRERFDIHQLEAYSPCGLEGDVAAIRAALGEALFAAEWAAGKRLTRAEAMALAMEEVTTDHRQQTTDSPQAVVRRPSSVDPLAELTPREREVALLMAHGRTNEEIANELFITLKTVEKHAGNALGKLGFRNRVELAAWMAVNGYL